MRIWNDFKAFVTRGNVVGLAIAVVIGTAFGLVVTSFVNDVLMQFIAAIGAKPKFEDLAFTVNGSPIRYGAFLNALISFLIVAAAMFVVVKAYNKLVPPAEKRAEESEKDLLREIRDELREQHRPRAAGQA